MKKVFIIHCWGGNPKESWYPWLKRKLESKDFEVHVPLMPNSDKPEIKSWVNKLKKEVKNPDEKTYFVGHSIGSQTILRYLEALEKNVKVGKIIFVGGWFNLKPAVFEEEGAEEIAKPWIETPINLEKVKEHTDNFVAIFSDDDPYIPLKDSKIFRKKLKAKIIIEKNKGHFNEEGPIIKELPIVLNEILKK